MTRLWRATTGCGLALCLAVGATTIEAASPPSGMKRMFNDTTYQELQPYAAADRLVAVLRCDAIETLSPGSRNERQQIRGTLLAGPATLPQGSSLLLARHAQGKPLMEVGKAYLIVAYRESTSGPWALLEHRLVDASAASREYEKASDDVAARLDAAKPR